MTIKEESRVLNGRITPACHSERSEESRVLTGLIPDLFKTNIKQLLFYRHQNAHLILPGQMDRSGF